METYEQMIKSYATFTEKTAFIDGVAWGIKWAEKALQTEEENVN